MNPLAEILPLPLSRSKRTRNAGSVFETRLPLSYRFVTRNRLHISQNQLQKRKEGRKEGVFSFPKTETVRSTNRSRWGWEPGRTYEAGGGLDVNPRRSQRHLRATQRLSDDHAVARPTER